MAGFGFGYSSALASISDVIPFQSDADMWFDGSIIESSSLYYLKDRSVNSRNALLKNIPCLEISDGVARYGKLNGNAVDAVNSEYVPISTDTIRFEFDFILNINPTNGDKLYYAGADSSANKGIKISFNSTRTVTVAIADGTTLYSLTTTATCNIGYNRLVVELNFTTSSASIVINEGTARTGTITATGGDYTGTFTYLSTYQTSVLPCYLVRFSFTKNSTKLHEYFFNDSMPVYVNSAQYYVFADLQGNKDLFLYSVADPMTGFQNSDVRLITQGYDVYARTDWPDDVFYCAKQNSGTSKTTLGTGHYKYTLIGVVAAMKLGYGTCLLIDFNPTDAAGSVFDKFDVTNRTYWKVAIESATGYNAAEKWTFHRTWLQRALLETLANTNHVHAKHKNFSFTDVDEVGLWKTLVIAGYANEHARTIMADAPDVSKYNNFYFTRNTQSGDRYLVAANGNKRFYKDTSENRYYYSADKGVTLGSAINLDVIKTVAAHDRFFFTSTGSLIWVTSTTKVYRSTDNGQNWVECTYLASNGSAFTVHSPANASYPGRYFSPMDGWYEDSQMLILGNYANSGGYGASPIQVWYSLNDGATWKIAFQFGQSLGFRDDGTDDGGSTGTLLGDATQDIKCRHIHGLIRNPYDGSVWVFTGDAVGLGEYRDHWMRGVYDSENDTWTWADLVATENLGKERYRVINVAFKDANNLVVSCDGLENIDGHVYILFNVAIADINNLGAWVPITTGPPENVSVYFFRYWSDGRLLVKQNNSTPFTTWYSLDWGATWTSVNPASLAGALDLSAIGINLIGEYCVSPSISQFTGALIRLVK